ARPPPRAPHTKHTPPKASAPTCVSSGGPNWYNAHILNTMCAGLECRKALVKILHHCPAPTARLIWLKYKKICCCAFTLARPAPNTTAQIAMNTVVTGAPRRVEGVNAEAATA